MKTIFVISLLFAFALSQTSDHCDSESTFMTNFTGQACAESPINSSYSIETCPGTTNSSFQIDAGTQQGVGSKICPSTIVKNQAAGLLIDITNLGAAQASVATLKVEVYYASRLFYTFSVPKCAYDINAQTDTREAYDVSIPSIAPSGNWYVQLHYLDASANELTCARVNFTI